MSILVHLIKPCALPDLQSGSKGLKIFNLFRIIDPIPFRSRLQISTSRENNLRPKELIEILSLSKGAVSKIMNYHKGLSKETIRKLSDYFKVSQEAFNRPYKLVNKVNRHFRDASLMNTEKDLGNTVAV